MVLIKCLHIFYLLFPALYILLGGPKKYYDVVIVLIVSMFIHWIFFNGECIMSYLEKKSNNGDYHIGENKKSALLCEDNKKLDVFCMLAFVASGLYLTVKLGYNIPAYLFIIFANTLFKKTSKDMKKVRDVLIVGAFLFYLKDSQHLISALLFLIGGSAVVKYKDKNSCIRGSQVTEDSL